MSALPGALLDLARSPLRQTVGSCVPLVKFPNINVACGVARDGA